MTRRVEPGTLDDDGGQGSRPLLRVRGLAKEYAVRVLDGIELDLCAGEVHALVGANGAGKSTLCRIVAGLTAASAGEMTLAGEPYRPTRKRDAEAAGVQIVQQELNLVPTLTVAESLCLDHLPHRFGWIDRRRLVARARAGLQAVGLGGLDPDTGIETLGVGTRQLVAIAAALMGECRVLILDEPTTALTPVEAERLFDQVHRLRDSGVCVVYVSHRLDEVERLADRVSVLRDGRLVLTAATEQVPVPEMIRAMTGEEPFEATRFHTHRRSEVALRVESLTRGSAVRDVVFTVHRGERLGIAGLVGSGRSELLRAVFGADPPAAGSVRVGSRTAERFRHPQRAVACGLALVTEDRGLDGLLLPQPVRVNVSLAHVPHRWCWVDRRRERERAEAECRSLQIQCRTVEQPAAELSGGNQQKVVVAKWLESNAEVLLLDEPTRGIDVAARRRMHALFEELARSGKALVIVSSDLDELMELCDAIVVMARGRLVARFERGAWSRREIVAATFAGASEARPA